MIPISFSLSILFILIFKGYFPFIVITKYWLYSPVLQYFLEPIVHPTQRVNSLEKTDAGKDWRQEKGRTEDEMVG